MTGVTPEFRQTKPDLSAFHEIARALTSSLDLEAILTSVMRQMENFFGPEAWTLLLTDEDRRVLYYAIADGRFGCRLVNSRVAYGEGIIGQVAKKGEMLLVPDAANAHLNRAELDDRLGLEVRSTVCIPLLSRLRTLGVIQLFNLPAETFSDYGISCLTVLSDMAAIAIQNARTLERVQELTITDECTGLYNMRHLGSMLRNELARGERFSTPLSLIFIDLDHFKQVNDAHGHQVGSQLLAAVSATIRGHIRSIDMAFRYGGDEFVVLLPGAGKHQAIEVANRLLSRLRTTNHLIPPQLRLNVRASIGVSSFPEDGKSPEELLRAADARMYAVKASNRDGIAFARETAGTAPTTTSGSGVSPF